MTAAWSMILMLMGWLPGNGAVTQGSTINAPDSLNRAPPACVSVSDRLEREQRQALTLERSA